MPGPEPTPSLRGQGEARLLAVERGLDALDDLIRRLRQQERAIEQGIWDAWDETTAAGPTAPAPTPTPTEHVSCHGGLDVLLSLPFTDSIFGSGTLVWDGTSKWTACLSSLAYLGGILCSNATIAIQYSLDTSCVLTVSWAVNNSSHCPTASGCPPAAGVGGSVTTSVPTANSTTSGPPATTTYRMGSSTNELRLRNGHTNQDITVTYST